VTALGDWPLQKGLVATLRANAAFMAKARAVLDFVPEDEPCPFVAIAEGEEVESSTFTERGHSIDVDIEVWTEDASDTRATTGAAGYRQALAIAELLVAAVTPDGAVVVDGHHVISVFVRKVKKERSPDGVSRVVTVTLGVWLEDSE
jgi:hypothetical protein